MDAAEIRSGLKRRFPATDRLGPEVYAVGGALRDVLMGRIPVDLDLVCRGAESEARNLASILGRKVVVLGRGDLAVYRVPAGEVEYDFAEMTGGSVESDLGRRDFTLNAIALETGGPAGLIDPFHGAADIDARVLRAISEANIAADPLRVIRGVRLCATLDLITRQETFDLLRRLAPRLASVAPERVTTEMDAILGHAQRGRSAELFRELGIDCAVFGEELSDETVAALGRLEGDQMAAYALLLLDWTVPRIEEHAARWRWSEAARRTVLAVITLVRSVASGLSPLPIALYDAGRRAAGQALAALRALGGGPLYDGIAELVRGRGDEIFERRPLLDGDAIGRLTGLPPGRKIGALRRALLEAQLMGRVETAEEASRFVEASVGQLNVDVADTDRDVQE